VLSCNDTISVTIPMKWTPGKLVEVTIPEGAPNAGTTIRFPVPPNSKPGSVIQVPIGVDRLKGQEQQFPDRHSVARRNGPLTMQQLAGRTTSTKNTILQLKSVTIRYACVSQCGYYPHELTKPNQDSYGVQAPFANSPEMAMFSVYDGHGEFGDLCSQFSRDKLHANLTARLEHGQDFMTSYAESFVDTNEQLHDSPLVDDLMSGTTAVSVIVNNGVLHVGNCGDSRAIIIRNTNEESLQDRTTTTNTTDNSKSKSSNVPPAGIRAIALSKDQTPFRRDERERVKKTGARVMTMDQLDGMEPIHEDWDDVELGEQLDTIGDPPRVWAPHECYPGTAFTRSIGDAEAEELGVFAEPELHSHTLVAADKYVVVASDGVFEFITNQEVATIVSRIGDPHRAAQVLVAESYKRWLSNEPRSDDITVIVMELSELAGAGLGGNGQEGGVEEGPSGEWRGRHSVAFCGNNP